jgi:hypothetical protein
MMLQDHLLAKTEPLAKRWFERILSTFPEASARILRRNTTSFANPFAQTMIPALEGVLRGLAAGSPPREVRPHLDAIVRIRAVQEFRPGTALAFLIQLKDIVREEAAGLADAGTRPSRSAGDSNAGDFNPELSDLEDRIDGALLMAFDLYTACREQIHSLRSDQRARALEMATPGRPSRRSSGGGDGEASSGEDAQHRN